MDSIDVAIEAIESRKPGELFTYTEVANRFGVGRDALSRRHRGTQRSRAAYKNNTSLLDHHEELELVGHIKRLTADGLPPTRSMIRNFASEIAKTEVSESWVTRFLKRHSSELTSRWTTGLDRTRHKADSVWKYELYFKLLSTKIEQYHIQSRDIYNMDEKGFLTGVIGRSKRVFSKQAYDRGGVKKVIQDGNREWITVLAAICADGSALPPSIIYQSAASAIYDRWVGDITSSDSVFVTSSPSGWTNNEVGLSWVKQVFNRHTKEKAGYRWRLLILDGHGSHVTLEFIEYCVTNRIALLVLPPHSTHTLQPLDVVMFKPLASAYSLRLQEHLQRSRGLLGVRKGDFWSLFKPAWESSFITKHIFKAFKATGVAPIDAEEVLKKFRKSTPQSSEHPSSALSTIDDVNRRTISHLIACAGVNTSSIAGEALQATLLSLHTSKEILEAENEGLRSSLRLQNQDRKQKQPLEHPLHDQENGGAMWFSPTKLDEARHNQTVKEQQKVQEQLQKAEDKELKQAYKIYQIKIKETAKVERERVKKEKEKEKAEKAAARDAQKRDRDAKKLQQQKQKRDREVIKSQSCKPQKKKRRVGGAARAALVEEPAPAPQPSTTRRGRTINTPGRFR